MTLLHHKNFHQVGLQSEWKFSFCLKVSGSKDLLEADFSWCMTVFSFLGISAMIVVSIELI